MNTVAKKHFEFWFDPLSQQNTPFSACGLKLGLFMSWPNVNELPIYIEMDLTWNILVVICLGQKVPNHTGPHHHHLRLSHRKSMKFRVNNLRTYVVLNSRTFGCIFSFSCQTDLYRSCLLVSLFAPFLFIYFWCIFFSLFFSSVLFLFIKHPCVLLVYTIHWLYM